MTLRDGRWGNKEAPASLLSLLEKGKDLLILGIGRPQRPLIFIASWITFCLVMKPRTGIDPKQDRNMVQYRKLRQWRMRWCNSKVFNLVMVTSPLTNSKHSFSSSVGPGPDAHRYYPEPSWFLWLSLCQCYSGWGGSSCPLMGGSALPPLTSAAMLNPRGRFEPSARPSVRPSVQELKVLFHRFCYI